MRRLYFLVTLLLVTVSGSVDPYNGANNSGRPPETAGLNHTHRYAGNTVAFLSFWHFSPFMAAQSLEYRCPRTTDFLDEYKFAIEPGSDILVL